MYDDFAESYCDSRAEAERMFGESGGDRWEQSHKSEDLRLVSMKGCIKIDNNDSKLNYLRKQAEETNDISKVLEYKREKDNVSKAKNWWLINA